MEDGIVFTMTEMKIACACLMAPQEFRATDPELRACESVVRYVREGGPLEVEDVLMAKRLFEAATRMNSREADNHGRSQLCASST